MLGMKVHTYVGKRFIRCSLVKKGSFFIYLTAFLTFTVCLPYFIMRRCNIIHVDTLLPTISDAAGSPPQTGVYSFLLPMASLLYIISIQVGYVFTKLHIKKTEMKINKTILNLLSYILLILGYISVIGLIIVAGYPINFRENNHDWIFVTVVPHLIGSAFAFDGFFLYCLLYTYFMWVLGLQTKKLRLIRLISLSAMLGFSFISLLFWKSAFRNTNFSDFWTSEGCIAKRREYNFAYTIIALTEWIVVGAFQCFTLTLVTDFDKFPLRATIIFGVSGKKRISIERDLSSTMLGTNAEEANMLVNQPETKI